MYVYIGRFYSTVALSVWTNLGKHFVVRMVMRLKYKDGHKTHYALDVLSNVFNDALRKIVRLDA